MIVYSGTKSRFHIDVMSNDIGNIIYINYQGAAGHHMEPLPLKCLGTVIPNAEAEEFMVVAELICIV